MKYNPNPNKGDPVRVRLPSGKIADGEYREPFDAKSKKHFVVVSFQCYLACKHNPITSFEKYRVRFVYPVECMQ